MALAVANLPTAQVRLGLDFGCGNTIYGATTGNPMRYVSFNGPPSTVSILITNYPILDSAAHNYIGPIGVDVVNQRLIGASTAGTGGAAHSMNLFDLSALVAGVNNSPIDSKPFPVSVGTFGTGSVDFTPDGSRVYTLDSGSGVIAFTLNPKLAAPTICSQPMTHIVAGPGSVGFMDVMAIGAPQEFQWRFNATSAVLPGTPILNATNRTLDIYNVQPANLGYYSVVITNATLLTSVTSAVAVLDTQMVVTNQPASQVVAVGGAATFTVGVSNGVPAYSYQWKFDGTNVGINSSSYTVSNAQETNGGAYTVVITDALGQIVTSQTAALTVGQVGAGDGLRGDYYNLPAFSGPPPTPFAGLPVFSRVDPTVNFSWGTASPDSSVTVDYFTARWSGQVQPFYTQTHTFYTASDDGSQLWVNGHQVVTNWATQGTTEKSGTIALNAGQKYDIVMEYYEQGGGAVAQLSWSSPNLVKQIIPQSQLYSAGSSPVQPLLHSSQPDATHLAFTWNGSYVLESTPTVEGPWAAVSGAASPYTLTIDPGTAQVFFRLLSQ
jgi:hypothetical protein